MQVTPIDSQQATKDLNKVRNGQAMPSCQYLDWHNLCNTMEIVSIQFTECISTLSAIAE